MSNDYYQEKICNICKQEYKFFLNKKNVIGLAFGYKIINGFCTYRKCIVVLVRNKIPYNQLSELDLLPKYYKGIPIDIVQCGVPKFQSLTGKVRPILNGYSIGNAFDPDSTGTCGCLVKDSSLYVLSCNHVLASNNQAPIQTIITQPSMLDGGKKRRDKIAHLYKFIPIQFIDESKRPQNILDCALGKVINSSFVSSEIALIGIPKGTSKPILHQEVCKVGCITEKTYGMVNYISATVKVEAPAVGKFALFVDQIITSKMADDGDSGSPVLDKDLNILGICMSASADITVFTPIGDILSGLGVQLVTK